MNAKYKYLVLPLILGLLFGGKKDNYENILKEYKRLPTSNSKYNFDDYNEFVSKANNYYNAFLVYINYSYFLTLNLENNQNYYYDGCSLFYFDNNYTFYKNGYSLSIKSSHDYLSFELKTSLSFYLYFSYDYLDFRCDEKVFFIKDKYRICIENFSIKSILSYKDLLYYENDLYSIKNNELIELIDIEKENELLTIANIYLTEYF